MRVSRAAAVVALALALAGCTSGTPAGDASCPPRVLLAEGATYRPMGDQPEGATAGEPVEGAVYAGCSDTRAGDGPQPTQAWRVRGDAADHLLTLTACATAVAGSVDAQGCLPDAPRYQLWTRTAPSP